VPVAAFPAATAVTNAGKTESLAEVYRYGGAAYARDALASALGAPIDRYVRMDSEVFEVCAAAVGAVEVELTVPVDFSRGGASQTLVEGRQLLDGARAAAVIGYRGYPENELGRCRVTASLTAAIIDQRRDICASAVFGALFEKLVNIVSTDISYPDYYNRREAAEYMAKLPQSIARPLEVTGEYSEDGGLYYLSDTFLAMLSQTLR
jgi:anionic cell wall polymer biosynthesis LytR-Cps2A-Psr (LCP) family protein